LLVCYVAVSALAAGPAPKLAPSIKFTVVFPELPPTFYRLDTGEKIPTQMTVFLPANYDRNRKHPLLIFLDGGNGGGATNPKVARALSEEKDFVCVILPLFKEKLLPKEPAGGGKNIPRILMHPEEAPYMWPIFKKMLARLDKVIPNLDPKHQIIGGFSNGAHTIAAMISDPNCDLTQRFSGFLLVEGGGRLQHLESIKGKAILMVWGNERSRSRAQQNCDDALKAGAKASFYIMNNVGHDFPVKEYPALRAWLRGEPWAPTVARATIAAKEDKETAQTKTGVVKKVDVNAKQLVVMAARELTFTITDSTQIQQHGKPIKLFDIKVGATVDVEYVKDGETRTAKKIVLVMAAGVAHAAAPTRKLVPGSTVTVIFPDMPPTFHAVSQKKNLKAAMTVFLPTNYDPGRKHPLLILLEGGDGGVGGNPGVARAISGERDFVCVSVPLFKTGDPKKGLIMVDADGKYMWPFFKAMLVKLEEMVPNLAPEHRVLGGSSNGAHATAALLDESDGEVARRFSAFVFVEGGGKMKHFEYLKGKHYMMVSSQSKSKPRALEICNAAKAAGAKTTFLCEDVGKHCFPESAYPAVRTWLRGPVME